MELILDLVDRLDDVGARLLEYRQDDAGLIVLPAATVRSTSGTAWPTSRTPMGAPLR